MEYQKIINLLDNEPTEPSKFRIESWVEINHESHETYNSINQTKLKTKMLQSSLCDNSDVYILVKGTIIGIGQEENDGTIRFTQQIETIEK